MAMITEVEDYFALGCGRCARFATPDCSTRRWLAGLLDLRRIAREAGLTEVAKWGHPVYMHAGRNIAIIGAFREDFRLSFMEAGLMQDPDGVLVRQGPNSAHADALRFTDTRAVAAQAATIRAYLAEAMGYAEAGLRAEKPVADLDLPDALVAALDDDPELAEAFHALTPGRQKSHVFALKDAKTEATRIARIAKLRPKILAGKGALDR
jgi:uncharacterized protein YdeI (YjbR/CyaY-like superfamily)